MRDIWRHMLIYPHTTLTLQDPTRDSYDVPEKDVILSYDVDSINLMAHQLKVLGDVDIVVLPYSGQRPPT